MTPYYADDFGRLYHGDCRDVAEWLCADVLVTDPPYGRGFVSRALGAVANDHDTSARDAALQQWGDRPALVFGAWQEPRPRAVRQRLIWHKANITPALGNTPWSSADEEIYVIGSGWGKPVELNVITTTERRAGNGGLAAKQGHPTPKPFALMYWLIARCPPGTIADPFAGSGSTLAAARAHGRRWIGVELDEAHCERIARRMAQEVLAL